MLSFKRRVGESVVLTLPDGRQVRIINGGPSTARIATDAPPDVTIHRGEVQEAIDERESQMILDTEVE